MATDEITEIRIQLAAFKLILGVLVSELVRHNPDEDYFLEILSRFDKLLPRANMEGLDVSDESTWQRLRHMMSQVMDCHGYFLQLEAQEHHGQAERLRIVPRRDED